jgi:hypothetical protein
MSERVRVLRRRYSDVPKQRPRHRPTIGKHGVNSDASGGSPNRAALFAHPLGKARLRPSWPGGGLARLLRAHSLRREPRKGKAMKIKGLSKACYASRTRARQKLPVAAAGLAGCSVNAELTR